MELYLTFEEAVFGVEREVQTREERYMPKMRRIRRGTRRKNLIPVPNAMGRVKFVRARRTIFGQMSQVSTCDQCEGTGKVAETPCTECRGAGTKRRLKTLRVKIPAGVDDGQRIRVAREGEVGYRGSVPGDLYIRLHVKQHQVFKRQGENIYSEIPISFYQAALGTKDKRRHSRWQS
jgi:molecular chaperone DnaJ